MRHPTIPPKERPDSWNVTWNAIWNATLFLNVTVTWNATWNDAV
jgi:hypothetical protein